MQKTGVAFVGVGDISGIYLENLTQMFRNIKIVGLCDLVREKAEKAAEKYQIEKIYEDMTEVFADPAVEIVINLTRPYEHYEVTKAALLAGKNVYSEKPLAGTLAEGKELIELAKEKELLLGGAPDTFMGAGVQTCRKLIEDGFIGEPIGFNASMICRGHETWHPDLAFYYQFAGGPMMDMGPYYVTALVNLLGEVKNVTSRCKTSFEERVITSAPRFGEVVKVEVPTYITGIMEFENDVIGTLFTTFDVYATNSSFIEIYGSAGSLRVPDPNNFGDAIYFLAPGESEYKEIPLLFDFSANSRGIGISDMANTIQKGEKTFRANVEQTYHVLEVMTAFDRSNEKGAREEILSSYQSEKAMERSDLPGVVK